MDLNGDGRIDAEDVRLGLDKAEAAWSILRDRAPMYVPQLRGAVGFGTLLYSRSFPYTIVFCQAFRVTGWPQVKDGWSQLAVQYSAARAEFNQRAPSLKQAKETVARYQADLAALQAAKASPEEIERLHTKYREAKAVLSSLSALLVSVDPYRVAAILGGMWTGVASCIAATVAPSARCIAIGLNIGERAAEALRLVLARFASGRMAPPGAQGPGTVSGRRWTEFYIDSGCRAAGMILAFYMQRMVNSFEVHRICPRHAIATRGSTNPHACPARVCSHPCPRAQGCVVGASIIADAGAQFVRRRGGALSDDGIAAAQFALCAAGSAPLLRRATRPAESVASERRGCCAQGSCGSTSRRGLGRFQHSCDQSHLPLSY
jgi:hypothetical protein